MEEGKRKEKEVEEKEEKEQKGGGQRKEKEKRGERGEIQKLRKRRRGNQKQMIFEHATSCLPPRLETTSQNSSTNTHTIETGHSIVGLK